MSRVKGEDAEAWFARLDEDPEGLEHELETLAASDPAGGLLLAGEVWPYWAARGRLAAGRRWLELFLALVPPETAVHARAKALNGAGMLAFLQGEVDEAFRLQSESVELARRLGDAAIEADALVGLARAAMLGDDAEAMERYARAGLDVARAGGDDRRSGTALHHVAEALRRRGRTDEAGPYYREAIALHTRLGDRRSVALETHNYGRLEIAAGRDDGGERKLRKSLRAALELGHQRLVAYCLLDLADVGVRRGPSARVARMVGAADELFASIGAALEPEYKALRARLGESLVEALGQTDSERAIASGAAVTRSVGLRAPEALGVVRRTRHEARPG